MYNSMEGGDRKRRVANLAVSILTLIFAVLATILSAVVVHRTSGHGISSGSGGGGSSSGGGGAVSPDGGEPIVNLQTNKARVKEYHTGGQYDSDLWALSGTWQAHFSGITPRADNGTAVVFDCDDTVLSNWPEFLASDFGYIPNQFDAWVERGDAPPIKPTVQLALALYKAGFDIYFITGRPEKFRAATLANLHLIGLYTSNDRLILRDAEEEKMHAVEYKSKERAQLVARGIEIAGCAGDQISDCAGGNAGYIMKVPNYIYLIK
jgi:acid phosphatase